MTHAMCRCVSSTAGPGTGSLAGLVASQYGRITWTTGRFVANLYFAQHVDCFARAECRRRGTGFIPHRAAAAPRLNHARMRPARPPRATVHVASSRLAAGAARCAAAAGSAHASWRVHYASTRGRAHICEQQVSMNGWRPGAACQPRRAAARRSEKELVDLVEHLALGLTRLEVPVALRHLLKREHLVDAHVELAGLKPAEDLARAAEQFGTIDCRSLGMSVSACPERGASDLSCRVSGQVSGDGVIVTGIVE